MPCWSMLILLASALAARRSTSCSLRRVSSSFSDMSQCAGNHRPVHLARWLPGSTAHHSPPSAAAAPYVSLTADMPSESP